MATNYGLDVWIVSSNSKESDKTGEYYGSIYYRPEGQANWSLLTQATDSNTWTVQDDIEGSLRGDDIKIGSTEFQLSTSVTFVEVQASIKEYDPSIFDADEDLGSQTASITITRFSDTKSINLSCGSGEAIELQFNLYEKTQPSGVTIYRDSNYQGTYKTLGVGSYDYGSLWEVGNDQVSSLEVPPGWKATLYEHGGFTGRTKTFTQNASYVGDDFNDIASGIKVEKII